jgi:guanylate kinase
MPVGNLFVIAAPSGGGKTTLTRALLEREPAIRLSVSYTTRPPRPGERDGADYHFVTLERFMALKAAGEFLEHAHVHGNWYATSGTWLKAEVAPGATCSSKSTGRARPGAQARSRSVHVFILPPSSSHSRRRQPGTGRPRTSRSGSTAR